MKPPEDTGAPAPDTSADPRLAERDSLGRLFDPAKFKFEKDTIGRWKNLNAGRRKAPANTPEPAPVATEQTAAPGAPAEPAPTFDEIERAAGAPTPEAGETPAAEQAAPRDATLSPEAGGSLLARALYKITGTATGDHKAAVATGAEHKAIAGTFADYLRFRGLALVGLLALGGTVLAYLLDDARGEGVTAWFKGLFAKKPKPGDNAKRAEPIETPAAPVSVHSVAPARPGEVSPVPASAVGDRF